jgi:hypothetical protein
VLNVVGYFDAFFCLKSETNLSFGGGGVIAFRCCEISNALFGLGELTEPLEFGLLEEDENPLEEGLTALGLLEEDDEERDEEKPLDDEERDEEKPLPFASITGSKIIEIPRIRYVIYFFIVFVKGFNIQKVFLLSRLFCNFS